VSANPKILHPVLRPLEPGDLDRVMEIELQAYPYPWTRGIFSDCLRVGYDCWGMKLGERLAGYCILSHAAGESHLLNLCIAPEYQRRGLGNLMLGHALRRGRAHGSQTIFLEVRPSNPAGFELYRKNGFREVGRRRDYYTAGDEREDALVMRREL
jgi:ribosomal-protein-alanine N-acetyltransferase